MSNTKETNTSGELNGDNKRGAYALTAVLLGIVITMFLFFLLPSGSLWVLTIFWGVVTIGYFTWIKTRKEKHDSAT